MAGPQRASDRQIREVLAATVGNVTAAAKLLGIAKNSLYKRLRTLELQPAAFRTGNPTLGPLVMGDVTWARVASPVTRAQKSETDTFPKGVIAPSFLPVQPASRVGERAPSDGYKNVSIREGHFEAVSRARRKLAAVLDVDLTDADVIHRFIDDKLDEWVGERTREDSKR